MAKNFFPGGNRKVIRPEKNEIKKRGKKKEKIVRCCEDKWLPLTHGAEQWSVRAYSGLKNTHDVCSTLYIYS